MMDSILSAFLRSWEIRPLMLLFLVGMGSLYSWGWWQLRQRSAAHRLPRRGDGLRRSIPLAVWWRLAAYWSGLFLIVLALMSPIDVFASQLFLIHMIQHLLLVMVVPPLLWVANPMPCLVWGLPPAMRGPATGWLIKGQAGREYLRWVTSPGLVLLSLIMLYWIWHDPMMYDAALRRPWVHDLEHLTFFGGAMLFWWHVTGAAPHIHGRFSHLVRAAYAIGFFPANMLTGMALVFANEPFYSYYTTVPRIWGLSPLQDQRWGGIIMWVPGSMMMVLAGLIIIYRRFQIEDQQYPIGEKEWNKGDSMLAPGMD
ncbi:MAG TPA: cytochrome c oxidase assembly protein [Anaerolineae bacterium]|nr:cytochrome c oxidase assembly protein [Anaerolineae bacterium]